MRSHALNPNHSHSRIVPLTILLTIPPTIPHAVRSYKVLVDGADRGSGSLRDASFEPPLQPPVEVPDPDDVKPEDWVEEEM